MVLVLGVGDEAPEEEAGHDDGVVKGEPVRVPETQPLRARDTKHAKREAQLVNHLHLRNLLHVIPDVKMLINSLIFN